MTGSQRASSRHYRDLLTGGSTESALESVGRREADLSDSGIDERSGAAARDLHEIVRHHLGDESALHQIADRIAMQGAVALRGLRDNDEQIDLAGLEAIVRTDGSRPSFMIRNGELDRTTSPLGAWGPTLDVSAEQLAGAIACVGRIDVPGSSQGFEGTGFLVQENLILTNRHVLQVVAAPDAGGVWRFRPGASIDFGHEFRARGSVGRRALKTLVFTGPDLVKRSPVDHGALDAALIEIEPAPAADRPRTVLPVDAAADWAQPELTIFTIGYPANPGLIETPTLLEQLFQSTFGFKRLAPGRIMTSAVTTQMSTLAHDATTLGGNSGSVVLVAGREQIAAGLHYGGRRGEPRENWGHILGAVLDRPNSLFRTPTLREAFKKFGVTLIDRIAGGV